MGERRGGGKCEGALSRGDDERGCVDGPRGQDDAEEGGHLR